MYDLRGNVRDVMRAPRLALRPASLIVGTLGVLLAAGTLSLLTYLGVLVDGRFPLSYVWAGLGLFPWLRDLRLSPGGSIIVVLRDLVAMTVLLYTLVAASKLAFRRLKGDYSFGAGDAWGFARAHGHVVLALVSIILMGTAIVVAVMLLVSVVARLPWVGEIVLALAIIPGIVLAIAAIFGILVGAGVLLIGPAVVGTLEDDWLDMLIHVTGIMWGQWWRWLFYELTVAAISLFGGIVAAIFLGSALALCVGLAGVFVPDKMLALILAAARYLPDAGAALSWLPAEQPTIGFEFTRTIQFGGIIFAAIIVLLAALVFGYVVSVWASGQTLAYIALRKLHLGQNILDREDGADRLAALAATRLEERRSPASAEGTSGGQLIHVEAKREG